MVMISNSEYGVGLAISLAQLNDFSVDLGTLATMRNHL